MSKFIMKIVCYFKKHFVTRIRNFVFTYRKSIERKCPVTSIMYQSVDKSGLHEFNSDKNLYNEVKKTSYAHILL